MTCEGNAAKPVMYTYSDVSYLCAAVRHSKCVGLHILDYLCTTKTFDLTAYTKYVSHS